MPAMRKSQPAPSWSAVVAVAVLSLAAIPAAARGGQGGYSARPGPPARAGALAGRGDREDEAAAGLHGRAGRGRAGPRQPGGDDVRRARADLGHASRSSTRAASPAPGKDRVKILEDTDGDGKVDKVTIFADGLNIPCGVAVGHGGVWVANSPDILFLKDTDGDGKADTAGGHRHRLRPRRHARAAQLPHLGPRRLALRHERRLQPRRR